jgi:hypothetical protein
MDRTARLRVVDLLNGERVIATKAVISNLTVWDTYGKLIGMGQNVIRRFCATQTDARLGHLPDLHGHGSIHGGEPFLKTHPGAD